MNTRENSQSMEMNPLNYCLCCGSKGKSLRDYLNLGLQPPPNAFSPEPVAKTLRNSFPLNVAVCTECSHSQVVYAVNPEVLFSGYTYRTGVSQTLRDHYAQLARDVVEHWDDGTFNYDDCDPSVLDIGCNDGTLLEAFKLNHNFFTVGVDMCEVEHQGVDEYYEGCWGLDFAVNNTEFGGLKFDIITATNVLAHTPEPKDFMRGVSMVLEATGVAVFEFPYARRLLEEAQFDTIYHEHYSYFLVSSFVKLLVSTGMFISCVHVNRIHGGSIRFYLRKCEVGKEEELSVQDADVHRLLCEERAKKFHAFDYENSVYPGMQARVQGMRLALLESIFDFDESVRAIVGFGASAKSTVMLNHFDLDMQYIVDETPCKQNKFSPGRNIKVVPPIEMAEDRRPLAIVVMSWNCMAESIAKIKELRRGYRDDIVVTYLPEVRATRLTDL